MITCHYLVLENNFIITRKNILIIGARLYIYFAVQKFIEGSGRSFKAKRYLFFYLIRINIYTQECFSRIFPQAPDVTNFSNNKKNPKTIYSCFFFVIKKTYPLSFKVSGYIYFYHKKKQQRRVPVYIS